MKSERYNREMAYLCSDNYCISLWNANKICIISFLFQNIKLFKFI